MTEDDIGQSNHPSASDGQPVETLRIKALKEGRTQFGHGGRHIGNGAPDCPRESHHHHDEFCDTPHKSELLCAGIDPETFKVISRR